MNISDRILSLRKSRGLSQEELADKLGVSRQSVSKWESEQSVPDLDKIIALSEFFEVTTDYLLRGIEAIKPAEKSALTSPILTIVATAMNAIGVVLSCLIWYQEQQPGAVLAGFVFLALGLMLYFIGQTGGTSETRVEARCRFWRINTWLIWFVPLSCLFNLLRSGILAPYPLFSVIRFGYWWAEMPLSIFVFAILYFGPCLTVMLRLRRK